MNHWNADGGFGLHVFHKNNEIAGYCSVLHALQLCGSTGDYGRRLNAVVIGFGATARGAVTALNAHGIHDVRVLTNRDTAAVGSPIPSVDIIQFEHDPDAPVREHVNTEDGPVALAPFLAEHDIVVNCTLQDPNAPLTYLRTEDLDAFRPGSLIVDVSSTRAWASSGRGPPSFADPMFTVGESTNYYAVDHSPSYLWNSATWEISEALMPFLAHRDGGTRGVGRVRHHQARDRDRGRAHPQRGDPAVPGALGRVPVPAARLIGRRRPPLLPCAQLRRASPAARCGIRQCRRARLSSPHGSNCNRVPLHRVRLDDGEVGRPLRRVPAVGHGRRRRGADAGIPRAVQPVALDGGPGRPPDHASRRRDRRRAGRAASASSTACSAAASCPARPSC